MADRGGAGTRAVRGAQRRKNAASSFLERPECEPTNGQVFWLPDRPTDRTFPRLPCRPHVSAEISCRPHVSAEISCRPHAPTEITCRPNVPAEITPWSLAAFVPGYGGGAGTAFDRFS